MNRTPPSPNKYPFDLSGCGRSCGCGGRCGSGSSLWTFLAHSDLVTQSGKGGRGLGQSYVEKIHVAILPSYWGHCSQLKMSKSHQKNIRVNKWTECFSSLSMLFIFMRYLFKTSPMETRPRNLLCNFCKARYLMFEALRGAFENPSKVAIRQAICCFKALWRSQWTEWKE